MGKVPPGQVVSKLVWPVLSATDTPDIDTKTYKLKVWGSVKRELTYTWDELQKLSRIKKVLDLHCVTRWSRIGDEWEGIPLKYFLNEAGASGKFLMLRSSYVDYSANVPMDYVNDDCMLVLSWNGKPLEPKHGGPIRAFIPTLYGWKSTKWLDGIEVMEKDKAGFWEERGYNMRGDYWKEERYWEGLNFVDKLLTLGRKKR